jgi:hypothetical protein
MPFLIGAATVAATLLSMACGQISAGFDGGGRAARRRRPDDLARSLSPRAGLAAHCQ